MEKKCCKVIIIGSQEIVREAIGGRVSTDCDVEVVAKAADGYSGLRACRQLRPDVIILDLAITNPVGMETLTRLSENCPEARVVVISEDVSQATVLAVLSRGAVAFLSSTASGLDYVNAVNAAISGFTYLPNDVIEEFVKPKRPISRSGSIASLSVRELEVLEACANGMTTKQVAANLSISVRTVETHRHSIHKKTACSSIRDLCSLLWPASPLSDTDLGQFGAA